MRKKNTADIHGEESVLPTPCHISDRKTASGNIKKLELQCPPDKIRLTGGTPGKHLENTPMSSSWRVPSRLFRSCSAGFLCELNSGSSLRWRCFALCEWPNVENWRTTPAAIIQLLCVNGAIVSGGMCTAVPGTRTKIDDEKGEYVKCWCNRTCLARTGTVLSRSETNQKWPAASCCLMLRCSQACTWSDRGLR